MSQSLQTSERDRLIACEQVIERGITVFVEVGKALTEIRDGRLYRATHKTFEAYCKERWGTSRSRAYQMIEQAEVATALAEASGNLSNALDISQRDASVVAKVLPEAVENIRQRVEAGEDPRHATSAVISAARAQDGQRILPEVLDMIAGTSLDTPTYKAKMKSMPGNEQFTAAQRDLRHLAHQQKARAALPQAVKDTQQRRLDASIGKVQARTVESLLAENAELREAREAQEREIASLRASLAELEGMRTQYEQGGFAKVIADKDEEIRVLETRMAAESRDKASWKKSADFWKEQANRLGYSDDIVIDMETGAVLANG